MMMEDTTPLYPLFGSADLPHESNNNNSSDSILSNSISSSINNNNNNKFSLFKKASGGFLTSSQAIAEEPLFSLFLSGGIAGLDESLLAGIVPDAAVPRFDTPPFPRQYMSIVPDPPSLDVSESSPAPSPSPTSNSSGTNGKANGST